VCVSGSSRARTVRLPAGRYARTTSKSGVLGELVVGGVGACSATALFKGRRGDGQGRQRGIGRADEDQRGRRA
jgi:hypothetical protein